LPITPQIGRFRFEDASRDLLNDYRTNGKRSVDEVEQRIDKHLAPFFGGRRMAAISTVDIRSYIAATSRHDDREKGLRHRAQGRFNRARSGAASNGFRDLERRNQSRI
jgi:hypothetical protein